jgi:hypothetical protein
VSIFLLAAEPPDPEGGLFHSQQAAEKALKGFLTWHDVPFRRVHELDQLGDRRTMWRVLGKGRFDASARL